ncbi:uncharacterized protein LOC119652074 [Hermetia illucens]|uniref:uncharacterized protein LOC119652074 n=1 Tax=Hermetia illucens TaxID=343691 RepID=UPI0018CC25DE|nr:uncharacterized protein LOC119652074 [Hermetia illucens]
MSTLPEDLSKEYCIYRYTTNFQKKNPRENTTNFTYEVEESPILKRGKDSSSLMGYRPISLLPNISKTFQVLILKALHGHIKKKELLSNRPITILIWTFDSLKYAGRNLKWIWRDFHIVVNEDVSERFFIRSVFT